MDTDTLPPQTPTVRLGNRTFAIVRQTWTDKNGKQRPQAYLQEMEAVFEGTAVLGLRSKFQGARLPLPTTNPERELREFCAAWVRVLGA